MNASAFDRRVKVLKRNAQAASSLTPQREAPSNLLADAVGMTMAALAMVLACLLPIICKAVYSSQNCYYRHSFMISAYSSRCILVCRGRGNQRSFLTHWQVPLIVPVTLEIDLPHVFTGCRGILCIRCHSLGWITVRSHLHHDFDW